MLLGLFFLSVGMSANLGLLLESFWVVLGLTLLGQGLGPWEAARLGVHLHGLAGDIAARQLTQWAMTARD